ncbi:hypothetical protein Lnau_0526 [Legionella nautarum]|uniref:Entry exclusion lipoprotein TrbK n=1 Tax=Legionella nautarum TaxID=45070 RepID=A0A0W0X1Z8_9GAMM|nr:hypothetical protein [Legionella nautarum]KTD38611.1 hypothetical protein Lnau_0526 [Legionella nautarum]
MKIGLIATLIFISSFILGCESEQAKTKRLSQLTCESSKVGRSREELTAIAEACFRKGNFVKSSGKEW